MTQDYANLAARCGGKITTESLARFRLAMIEHETYAGKPRRWMTSEIDPETGRLAEAPPLPDDLVASRTRI
jgi:hypothetical protein